MAHIKKIYAYTADGCQSGFHGCIKSEKALKRGFTNITLSIDGTPGKGRSEDRHFQGLDFAGMKGFS